MGYRLSSPETPAPVAAGASAPPKSIAVAIPPVRDDAAPATTERKKGSPGESGGASFPWGLGCFSGV